jgi:two-component system, NtrC family, response regulator AtoC
MEAMQPSGLAGVGILILEDELLLRKQMAAYLEKCGADVTGAESLERARKLIEDLSFDYVFLDVNLPDGRGTDLLKEKRFPSSTGVIVMTAEGAISGAVEAMRLGALDYLVKPFDPAELPMALHRARRAKQTERIDEQKRSDASQSRETFFFGSSLAELESQLEKILGADRRLESHLPPVLIEGETGTGKSTIARWLHHQGPRSGHPLIEVNCSALPETLAESELFGHERGAFTDARSARMGLFEAGDGGTLFLDELPSLSLALQAKVLTAIEDHKIRRVGGNRAIPVDVRIIAATNRNLKLSVEEGSFREDLYHRLDLFRISIPPLRARGDDILQLAERFLQQLCRRHRVPQRTIHAQGAEKLLSYPWPGNVRELAHELERAIVFEENKELKFEKLTGTAATSIPGPWNASEWFNDNFVFPAQGFSLEDGINRMIQHALKQSNQNVSAAARLLGVSRDYVRYRLSNPKGDGEGQG